MKVPPHLSLGVILSLLLSWLPVSAFALSLEDARHLVARTGFGVATPQQVEPLLGMSRAQAVDHIVEAARDAGPLESPYWVEDSHIMYLDLASEANRELHGDSVAERYRDELLQHYSCVAHKSAAHWWRPLVNSETPLREKMTLFWSDHFATGYDKVGMYNPLVRQKQTLRRHAMGSFYDLLYAISIDPAMLVYLDQYLSREGAINENFAREVMELFTLGVGGGYTEDDIKEAARAFTGWRIREWGKGFVFDSRMHDYGEKTVLGKVVAEATTTTDHNVAGRDALRIMMEHPSTARYITSKLWRAFISPDPDPTEVDRLARAFETSGYNISTLMRELLLSEAFWAPSNRHTLIKTPVDIVAGAARIGGLKIGPADYRNEPRVYEYYPGYDPENLRTVEIHYCTKDDSENIPVTNQLHWMATNLGMELYVPPNVSGWRYGEEWVNTATVAERVSYAIQLAGGAEQYAGLGADQIETLVLGRSPMNPIDGYDRMSLHEKVNNLIKDPVFQVK
mgnify:CR=1 FL=1